MHSAALTLHRAFRYVIMPKCFIFFAILVASPSISQAQFWHALPPVDTNHTIGACFSNDEKKVFYLSKDVGGIANIWGMTVADKYARIITGPANPPAQITKFSDRSIVRFFHLLNRAEILYMRLADDGKDYHIYKINDDGSGQPEDLTPGGDGVMSEIIGASYNGKFVYYTNNKVTRDKVDVYRYDTQQFTSDLVFPNDKDYKAIAWTRDQKKLLMEDSSNRSYMIYDIETTERTPIDIPSDKNITSVGLDPRDSLSSTGYKLQMLGFRFYPNQNEKVDTIKMKNMMMKSAFEIDYSANCKYTMSRINGTSGSWCVKEATTGTCLSLPEGGHPLTIAPKETMLVYSLPSPSPGNASKIFLYDIAKNSSTELATVR
jgi:hypothetical protein